MNQFKTVILMSMLVGLCMWLGDLVGGRSGMWMGLLIAGVGNFSSYFFSDKMVLSQFNAHEVTRSEEPHLYATIERLAQQASLPMPKVYLIDMPAPNAFATGRDPSHAAIAVSPSLMKMMSQDELEGVLAHELGHIKNYDILISSIAATVAGALSYIAQMAHFMGPRSNSDDEGRRGNPLSLLFLLIVTPLIGTLLHLAISRQREFAADEYAARLTRRPDALASALAQLEGIASQARMQPDPGQESSAHLFIINPFSSDFFQSLFSTHPPMAERIARLKTFRV